MTNRMSALQAQAAKIRDTEHLVLANVEIPFLGRRRGKQTRIGVATPLAELVAGRTGCPSPRNWSLAGVASGPSHPNCRRPLLSAAAGGVETIPYHRCPRTGRAYE